MASELSDFTWHSLYELIEFRITGLQKGLQFFRLHNSSENDMTEAIKTFEHELDVLQRYIPLVKEMQVRENMQVVCPIMSLNMIRLRCPHKPDDQDSSSDFAWISSIADGKFSIVRLDTSESRLMEELWSFEGNLPQTVEKIETLIEELCNNPNQ